MIVVIMKSLSFLRNSPIIMTPKSPKKNTIKLIISSGLEPNGTPLIASELINAIMPVVSRNPLFFVLPSVNQIFPSFNSFRKTSAILGSNCVPLFFSISLVMSSLVSFLR